MPAADMAAYMRDYRDKRRARMECIDCGGRSRFYRCEACRENRCKPESDSSYGVHSPVARPAGASPVSTRG